MYFRQQGCLAKEDEERASGRQLVISAHVGQALKAEEPEGKNGLTMWGKASTFCIVK